MIQFKNKDHKFVSFKGKQLQPVYLTGLIMVKNQEENIITAVTSLNKICDHIIVVDTGSTDRTVRNLKINYPEIEIKKSKWVEDYAYMRNKILNFVPKGWVFVLDSDEFIESSVSYHELHAFLSNFEQCKNDIAMTVMCRSNGTSTFIRRKSMFKVSSTIKYHGLVHEELISTSKLDIYDTNIEVLNRGTDTQEVKKFNKRNRYTKLLLKQLQLEPNNPRWTALTSLEYIQTKSKFRKTLKTKLQNFIFYQKINDFSVNNIYKNKYLKYNLYRYIFILNLECDFDSALKGCKMAIKLYPFDASFLNLYALILLELNDKNTYDILQMLTNNLEKYKNHVEIVHEESQGNEGSLDLIVVKLLMKLGYYTDAKDLLSKINYPIYKERLKSERKLFNL